MGLLYGLVAVTCCTFVVYCVWNMLNWVWFRPKRLEKLLRQRGFNGNSYKLLVGDLIEVSKMRDEATSKPISFSHDIVPRVLPFIHKTVEVYGTNSFFWIGPNPLLLIMDPEIVKEMLSKNTIFQKPPPEPIVELFAQGLAVIEGDKWSNHRRLINPAFHQEKLKHMLPAFYQSCREMLSKWDKLVPSEESCEVDVFPYLQTLTGDSISRTAFGSNYEEGRKVFELQKEQAELVIKASTYMFIPGWRFLPTRLNRRMKNIAKEVDSTILGIIDKRMNSMEGSTDDLLGILLESNIQEIQENGSKFGMSIQEVIQECKLFYFAGQETTASLLTWTMILLSKHLDWQARARDEVMQVFGSEIPNFDDLSRLKIVTMILHEVLRLYIPGVLFERVVQRDTATGNMLLPPGVQLLVPAIMLHHDCELWGEDAEEFNPERFSEGVSKATKGRFSYFPFGWGPRICIGQNFAMLEAKMTLAMILKNYSFELSPSYTHAPYILLILQPQHGAPLILRKL